MPNKPRPDNPARPVRFEDELWDQVRNLAARLGMTASAFVREAVREKIARGRS